MKLLTFLILFLSFKPFHGYALAKETLVDKVAASVNSDVILESEILEFGKHYKEYYLPIDFNEVNIKNRNIVLDILIDNMLIDQTIEELELKVSDVMLEKRIKEILQENKINLNQLKTMVSSQGQSFDEWKSKYRKEMERYLFINQEIRPKVAINEYDLKNFYQNKVGSLSEELEYDIVDFISKNNPEVLEKIKKSIEKDGFTKKTKTLCADHCTDLDLGLIKEDALIPEMAKALKGMKSGKKVSEIIKVDGMYHLLYLKSVQKSKTSSFEKIKEQLSEQYYKIALDNEIRNWLVEKRKTSFIATNK